MPGSSQQHQRCAAARVTSVRCAVLTVSDTRTAETDKGGPLVERLLREAGHEIVARAIVPDDAEPLGRQLDQWLGDAGVEAIVTTGGTGISKRDVTVGVVRGLLTMELEGFGEIFRMLSWQQVKGAAILSRAMGGLVQRPPEAGGDTFIFALPGSVAAVELAMTELIAPQLAHLVWHRKGVAQG